MRSLTNGTRIALTLSATTAALCNYRRSLRDLTSCICGRIMEFQSRRPRGLQLQVVAGFGSRQRCHHNGL